MCTLAWGKNAEGLWICFNRDERRTRPPADPPKCYEGPHGRVVYARDPEGGGTWLALSARGFCVAILNSYPTEHGGVELVNPRSRGQLVKELAEQASLAAALEALEQMELGSYPPFHLAGLSRSRAKGVTWDGMQLEPLDTGEGFFTTSSYQPAEVAAFRRDLWRQAGNLPPEEAAAWLRRTEPDRPAFGMTMDRDDARTVSQVLLRIGAERLRFSYRSREAQGVGFLDPLIIEISRTMQ